MKGQTAMEYLMTYGWAIVVIVIVLGVLAFMFSGAQTFEYCSFNPVGSFTCVGNPAVYNDGTNVKMDMTFRNGQSEAIEIDSYACVSSETGDVPTAAWVSAGGVSVQPGDTWKLSNNQVATCYRPDGSEDGSPANSKFAGRMVLRYRLSNDPTTITREATATVRGTVASG